nr:hypothetical protein [Paenibacillus massiliensis]
MLAVRGEEVQLRLEIDKDDGLAEPHWYPFAPPTGSAMYCLPQVGTKASLAKEYERKIDNSKYFSHDKGDFGEEVTKIVAKDSGLGKDVSDLFQTGRNGIDAAFLSKGPPPKLTIIESKASDSASFSYSDKQKKGGDKYFEGMINSQDSRYDGFGDKLEELMEENPGLKLEFIRVETDIKITDVGFGVDDLKVKDWSKEID